MNVPYAELNKLSSKSSLISLYTLTAPDNTVYRFTNEAGINGLPVVFGGATYTPFPIQIEGIDYTGSGAPPKPRVTVSNVLGYFLPALLTKTDLVGSKFTRIRVLSQHLDAASFPRLNVLNYSQDIDNAYWGKFNLTVTANATASPVGDLTAEKLVETTTANSAHFISRQITVSANTNYTYTVYAKAAERTRLIVYYGLSLSPFTRIGMDVDLTNGTWTNANVGTPLSVVARDVTSVGNGWYRIRMSGVFDATSTTTGYVELRLHNGTGVTYTGSAASGLYVWGQQLEMGVQATAYQLTTTTNVNPTADPSMFIGPDTFTVDQKVSQNRTGIVWQLTTALDRMGLRLPRRQALRDKGFPALSRVRKQ
jgi:lambda family phage minor tail protein L